MNLKLEWKWLAILAIVVIAVFANSLGGEFVYDDTRQILRNPLIQDLSLFWKAVTSDVWAFKGDGSVVASNYWRPTFTIWNILCFQLFGTSPVGWHVASVLLHSGVCVMVFVTLRRWEFSAIAAFVIALIFAVHPVHVESVAWIAGSPDLLFSLAFLGSLWFATNYRDSGSAKFLALSIIFYALALGAKEIGIVCLPIYYFVLRNGDEKARKTFTIPLAALGIVAVAYFFIRYAILGAISRPPDDAVTFGAAVMSIPQMFAFYLQQIMAPIWIAINYPLSPVEQIGLTNFVLPLLLSIIALAALGYVVSKQLRSRIAVLLFLLPLIPAMNATAFPAEQLVHDRYLYLPLLGVLMIIVSLATRFLSEHNLLIVGCVVSLLFAVQTVRYNSAYANELSLWSWTATVDNSAFTSMQLGSALSGAGKLNEAIQAYSNAIEKRPSARGFLGRGRTYVALKQYDKAEQDLTAVLAMPEEKQEAYALYQTYEALGIVYSEQKKFDIAAQKLIEARTALPIYSAALTEKLAIIYYQSDKKSEALAELEKAQEQARRELLPESKSVFLRLGMLYSEQNRKEDARKALTEYLSLTTSFNDKPTLASRGQATKLLERLK